MEWEEKTQMIVLGNKMNLMEAEPEKKAFQDYVLKKIETFDNQAFMMFFDIIQLIPEEMKSDSEFYSKIYHKTQTLDVNKFDMRCGIRLCLFNTICEEALKLS
jgi:hypothetical protein